MTTYIDVRSAWPVLIIKGLYAIELTGMPRNITVEDAQHFLALQEIKRIEDNKQ